MMAQCTATSKRTRQRCRRMAMQGRTVCYNHGGASPRGFAHPSTKTGRYSKALPVKLAATYQAARQDPDLLALNDKVALVEVRLMQLLSRVEEGGGARVMARIDHAFNALRSAMQAQNKERTEAAWEELGASITAGKQDAAIWRDIISTLEAARRLSESERKRLVEAKYMLPIDTVMNFVGAVAGVLQDTIKDRQTLMTIQAKVQKLLEKERVRPE